MKNLNTTHVVLFGETEIYFSLNCSKRKTLVIRVYPNGSVSVGVPLSIAVEQIYERVQQRAAWILKQQQKFENYPSPRQKMQYISGESCRYLGREYRLKVIEGGGEVVMLTHEHLHIETPYPENRLNVQRLLRKWYHGNALAVFSERYVECVKRVERIGIRHDSGFKIRAMTTRWGSCSSKGSINLNTELIAAPVDCIDYVILHELCHLKEHNHGEGFYRLLSVVMNDWELHRKCLNESVEIGFLARIKT